MTELATRYALVLVETGSPESPSDVRHFLTRLYSDPFVMDTPFGAEYQKLFSSVIGFYRASKLEAALKACGGKGPERTALPELAEALAAALSAGGESWRPYTAFRHAAPRIRDVVQQARQDGAQRVVLLFARPFATSAGSGSAAAEVRGLAADQDELPLSLLDRCDDAPELRQVYAELLREAHATLPEALRADAELLFTLRGQPIPGASVDPSLEPARRFVDDVCARAGLGNRATVAFQCGTDPRADLSPSVEEVLERFAREKKQAVVAMPLSHLVETLATKWELDGPLQEAAKARGVSTWVRAPCPGARPSAVAALEKVVRRHLVDIGAAQGAGSDEPK
ncbi:MAG: ferrochelatase [Myxococcales bacterium]